MLKKGIKTIRIHLPIVILSILSLLFFILINFDFNVTTKDNSSLSLENVFAKNTNEDFEKVYVSRVIDGDTFELKDKRIVRIIGVNAPENTTTKERYGDIASNYTKKTIEGKYVYLQKDVSETDKYDRILRNVWLKKPSEIEKNDIQFIKENTLEGRLLSLGYAKTMSINPDISLKSQYTSIAKGSQNQKKGLWSIKSITKGDF